MNNNILVFWSYDLPKTSASWTIEAGGQGLDLLEQMMSWAGDLETFLVTGKKQWRDKELTILGGGFKYFYFHPYSGKISNLTNIFQQFQKANFIFVGGETWQPGGNVYVPL